METVARPTRDASERRYLQRMADELAGYGWECTLNGECLTVTNPVDSKLTDQVVCRNRDDDWHYAFAFHKTQTLGHVDQVAEIALRIMSILGRINPAAHQGLPS